MELILMLIEKKFLVKSRKVPVDILLMKEQK